MFHILFKLIMITWLVISKSLGYGPGDEIIQLNEKSKSSILCVIHCVCYNLPYFKSVGDFKSRGKIKVGNLTFLFFFFFNILMPSKVWEPPNSINFRPLPSLGIGGGLSIGAMWVWVQEQTEPLVAFLNPLLQSPGWDFIY